MAGKYNIEDKEKMVASSPTPDLDRYQLSRQDASVSARKSPLGRTDELLVELDDEEDTDLRHLTGRPQSVLSMPMSPSSFDETTENDPIAPLKCKTSLGVYGSKSQPLTNNGKINDRSNNYSNGHVLVNGSSSIPELQFSSSDQNVSHSTSVNFTGHAWKSASFRPTSALNGRSNGFKVQKNVDENHFNRTFSLRVDCPAEESRSLTHTPSLSQSASRNGFMSANGSMESHDSNGYGNNLVYHGPDSRLQPSLSTPVPGENGTTIRKEEYRRFKSEGSTGGNGHMPSTDMDIPLDDLSPIADRASPSGRINLFQKSLLQIQDSVVNGPVPKQSQTEQVMMMHVFKTKLQKYQTFIDRAFESIQKEPSEQIFEGCAIVAKVMTKAWLTPKISHDLAYALCDYLREQNYFDVLIELFIKQGVCDSIRLCCGRVLEECMSLNNRDYIVTKGYLMKVAKTAEKLNKNQEEQRMSLSILENLFKHSTLTTTKLIEFGLLDHILLTCKKATDNKITLRHAALALANLSLYSSVESKKKIIQKKLPDWLFLLASQTDDITRYYACLAICTLGTSKEMESAVSNSGTLSLVEPFLLEHQPSTFAIHDYKHAQGRPKEWLQMLLPMLKSKCREAKSIAAFHFAMEAAIKKDQQKLEILQEIKAIEALKEVASSPDEVAAKFASEALTIIGEEVPYKLSQQVPIWTNNDVQYWVEKIGFGEFRQEFAKNMVDGDLLLLLSEKELEEDLNMKSGILRKRFMRELESLKIAADYSSVDESQLDQFLMSLGPELSVYTYQMLGIGLNRNLLPHLTNDMMKDVCGIQNPIHRLKLRQALQDSKHIDDIEVAILSKHIDVFISYRRSTGNQLASLIKVLLQLRGYKVFIDVDKLYAGKFDSHLLKNIQAAKHFVLVLTPHSLDRLLNDNNCEDWIHKELRCAFEHQKNVIPIFDQHFEFPAVESELPSDIRQITKFNGVRWVHDYQEACIDKVERFIKGELNRTPSIDPQQLQASPTSGQKKNFKLNGSSTNSTRPTVASLNRSKHPAVEQTSPSNTTVSTFKLNSPTSSKLTSRRLPSRSTSVDKQRRKVFSSASTVCSEK
ncbi:unnamed protein product [Bursaphelenchus xylophilus]|nr:unnamed protein product [Bursaphelenchus xylophilus]CAG9108019.1 unnamed protein product [Bursaphelenchus xylophilus]